MYLGPFFFDTREMFLVFVVFLLGIAMAFGWSLSWFQTRDIFTLAVIVLFTKGLLPAIHNEVFFILAIFTLLLTLFLPLFQVIIFYFVSFVLFRFFRVI